MMRLLAPAALVLSSLSLLLSVVLYDVNRGQRAEAVRFVCRLEFTLEEFVKAPPRLPRDRPAIRRLRALNCNRLVENTAK